MREELSEEEIAAVTVAFGRLDGDGDGVITRAELWAAMAEAGHTPSDAELSAEFARVDADADGRITLAEWLHMWTVAILRGA